MLFGVDLWLIWISLGIVFIIIEIFTPGFFFMSIGVASIITGLFSLIIPNPIVNLVLFVILCLIIFFNLKKFGNKYINNIGTETNVIGLIGKTGIVTREILPEKKGYVKIGGEEWSAVSNDEEALSVEEKVEVVNIEGNKLIVKKVK
jgi:membrane protein implicated in regulation of membrane protease activity